MPINREAGRHGIFAYTSCHAYTAYTEAFPLVMKEGRRAQQSRFYEWLLYP